MRKRDATCEKVADQGPPIASIDGLTAVIYTAPEVR
eukprot:SAG31_NODE_30967_length_374_cov_0.701818_1_plen_35_part_01